MTDSPRQPNVTESAILFLRLPGCEKTPAGVLVSDLELRQVLVQLRPLRESEEQDDDIQAFWSGLPEVLQSIAADIGPTATLDWLEEHSSHLLELGTRIEQETINSVELLERLFEENVVLAPVVKTLFGPEDLQRSMEQLPLLSSSAIQIATVLRDPDIEPRILSRSLEQDPVLTSHVIRYANSAAFAFSHRAKTVFDAVMRIGLRETKFQVFAATVSKIFSSPGLRELWTHSIKSAQIARQVAAAANLPVDESALLALVHDVGQIVIFGLGPSAEKEIKKSRDYGYTLIQTERRLCGTQHATVGADLLNAWNFPHDFCEAVRNHHTPLVTRSRMASLLYLVENLQGTNEDHSDSNVLDSVLERLGIEAKSVLTFHATLSPDLQYLVARL